MIKCTICQNETENLEEGLCDDCIVALECYLETVEDQLN